MAAAKDSLNFISGFLGLIFEPNNTPATLMPEGQKPKYVFGYISVFLLTVFLPLLIDLLLHPKSREIPIVVLGLAAFVGVAFFSFFIFAAVALRVLAVRFSLSQLIAAMSYCLVPFTAALWVLMILRAIHGETGSYILSIASGELMNGQMMAVFPYLFWVMHAFMALIMIFSLMAMDELHFITGFFLSIGLAVVYSGSIALAAHMANFVRPGLGGRLHTLLFVAGIPGI